MHQIFEHCSYRRLGKIYSICQNVSDNLSSKPCGLSLSKPGAWLNYSRYVFEEYPYRYQVTVDMSRILVVDLKNVKQANEILQSISIPIPLYDLSKKELHPKELLDELTLLRLDYSRLTKQYDGIWFRNVESVRLDFSIRNQYLPGHRVLVGSLDVSTLFVWNSCAVVETKDVSAFYPLTYSTRLRKEVEEKCPIDGNEFVFYMCTIYCRDPLKFISFLSSLARGEFLLHLYDYICSLPETAISSTAFSLHILKYLCQNLTTSKLCVSALGLQKLHNMISILHDRIKSSAPETCDPWFSLLEVLYLCSLQAFTSSNEMALEYWESTIQFTHLTMKIVQEILLNATLNLNTIDLSLNILSRIFRVVTFFFTSPHPAFEHYQKNFFNQYLETYLRLTTFLLSSILSRWSTPLTQQDLDIINKKSQSSSKLLPSSSSSSSLSQDLDIINKKSQSSSKLLPSSSSSLSSSSAACFPSLSLVCASRSMRPLLSRPPKFINAADTEKTFLDTIPFAMLCTKFWKKLLEFFSKNEENQKLVTSAALLMSRLTLRIVALQFWFGKHTSQEAMGSFFLLQSADYQLRAKFLLSLSSDPCANEFKHLHETLSFFNFSEAPFSNLEKMREAFHAEFQMDLHYNGLCYICSYADCESHHMDPENVELSSQPNHFLSSLFQSAQDTIRRTGGHISNDDMSPKQKRLLPLCQGCKLVRYCNKKCQRLDRANHQTFCKEHKLFLNTKGKTTTL